MELRPYQREAIDAVTEHLRQHDDNPCVVLPTGSGKTPVMASLCREYLVSWPGTRILILAHVKELLVQAEQKLLAWWPESASLVGVYSAGLRRRETDKPITIAGIQSVHHRADELGHFDLVFVDECHLIPKLDEDSDSMYRELLDDLKVINPHLRVIGLTATPYRLDTGEICDPKHWINRICYEANVRDLIDQGYLCRLVGIAGYEADVSGVNSRGGDFIPGELEESMADAEKVELACADIVKHCATRTAIVIFCCGVIHAGMVMARLALLGLDVRLLTGETPRAERDELIAQFKAGKIRALCNINVLSIGFDAPNIDAVVLLRPTQSPGLYYQQVGRGLRIAPGKDNCLVVDLAGNIRRHGPIDRVEPATQRVNDKDQQDVPEAAPTKACPACLERIPIMSLVCPACGTEFFDEREVAKHAVTAEEVSPLSDRRRETWDVLGVRYSVWTKRGALPGDPRTLMVEYDCGIMRRVREWVCFEHTNYARTKACMWWAMRSSMPVPEACAQAEKAIAWLSLGALPGGWREPVAIEVELGEKYPKIVTTIFSKTMQGHA